MTRDYLVGAGALILAGGCFSQEATLGLPCTSARSCGRDQQCTDGICQRGDEDPTYCPAQDGVVDLGREFPTVSTELRRTDGIDVLGECGRSDAEQAVYLWQAPVSGDFAVRVRVDASYWDDNTLLPTVQFRSGGCVGVGGLCAPQASGVRSLSADRDEVIVIVLDGVLGTLDADADSYSLSIDNADHCIGGGGELAATVPLLIRGTTRGSGDALRLHRCGSTVGLGYGPDAAFSWTAPRDGTFSFDAISPDGDVVVSVLARDCGGAILGCAEAGTITGAASSSVVLVRNQTVVVAVDSPDPAGVDFELLIDEAFGCVPEGNDLGFQFPLGGLVADADEAEVKAITTCVGEDVPQLVYAWTAPAAAFWTFDTQASDEPVRLSALEGSCGAQPVGCSTGAPGETAVVLPLNAGQSVVLAAAPTGPGNVVLTVEQAPCGSELLATPLPIEVHGEANARSSGDANCAGNRPELGDRTFAWRAPTNGTYEFEVEAAGFDPLLYLLDTSCGGRQFSCGTAIDGPLRLTLPGQQTVVVGVTAAPAPSGGPFTLRIREAPG